MPWKVRNKSTDVFHQVMMSGRMEDERSGNTGSPVNGVVRTEPVIREDAIAPLC